MSDIESVHGAADIQVWTDGAAAEGVENGGAGAVITWHDGRDITTLALPAGKLCSSTSAEASALAAGLREVRNTIAALPRRLNIWAAFDSMALHERLQSPRLLATDHQTTEAAEHLRHLGAQHSVFVLWVPGHAGLPPQRGSRPGREEGQPGGPGPAGSNSGGDEGLPEEALVQVRPGPVRGPDAHRPSPPSGVRGPTSPELRGPDPLERGPATPTSSQQGAVPPGVEIKVGPGEQPDLPPLRRRRAGGCRPLPPSVPQVGGHPGYGAGAEPGYHHHPPAPAARPRFPGEGGRHRPGAALGPGLVLSPP